PRVVTARGLNVIRNVEGARPDDWLMTTGTLAPALFSAAEKVRRPPPRFCTCTSALTRVLLQMLTESTTFGVFTPRIGNWFRRPMGITVKPEAEIANRYCPSGDATILGCIGSASRRPSRGVRLEAR